MISHVYIYISFVYIYRYVAVFVSVCIYMCIVDLRRNIFGFGVGCSLKNASATVVLVDVATRKGAYG